MAQRTVKGSKELGNKIKIRRQELGLTIEDASSGAGVGTKTWCRYESGESIRVDKCKGICKVLKWTSLPIQEKADDETLSIDSYRTHEAWSDELEKAFGTKAALSFAIGSDLLYDHIREDMEALASMRRGTHIGQVKISWLKDDLPEQFLLNYDYEFYYQMKCALNDLINEIRWKRPLVAHSVMQELVIYLCNEEAKAALEILDINGLSADDPYDDCPDEWVFGLFDDMDIITFLYSNVYLEADHPYHFSHWTENQFYNNK